MKPSISYCRHMVAEVEYLLETSRCLTKETFLFDETLKRAFVRSLEIIGEAVKQIPEDFRQKHPSIEWRKMAGTRDRLIHDYLGVDYELVWDVVQTKIPLLSISLREILEQEEPADVT